MKFNYGAETYWDLNSDSPVYEAGVSTSWVQVPWEHHSDELFRVKWGGVRSSVKLWSKVRWRERGLRIGDWLRWKSVDHPAFWLTSLHLRNNIPDPFFAQPFHLFLSSLKRWNDSISSSLLSSKSLYSPAPVVLKPFPSICLPDDGLSSQNSWMLRSILHIGLSDSCPVNVFLLVFKLFLSFYL